MVCLPERLLQLVRTDNRNAFISPRAATEGDNLHPQRAQQFGQPSADCTVSQNDNRLSFQWDARTPQRMPAGITAGDSGFESQGQVAGLRQDEAEDMQSAVLVIDMGTVRKQDLPLGQKFPKTRVVVAGNP